MSQAHTTSMSPMEANQSLVSIFASYARISLYRFLSIFFFLIVIYLYLVFNFMVFFVLDLILF